MNSNELQNKFFKNRQYFLNSHLVDSGTATFKEYEEYAVEFLAKERNLNDDLPSPPYKEEMGAQSVDTFIRLRSFYFILFYFASNGRKIHRKVLCIVLYFIETLNIIYLQLVMQKTAKESIWFVAKFRRISRPNSSKSIGRLYASLITCTAEFFG